MLKTLQTLLDNSVLLPLNVTTIKQKQIKQKPPLSLYSKINSKQFSWEIKPGNTHEINDIISNLIGQTHDTDLNKDLAFHFPNKNL